MIECFATYDMNFQRSTCDFGGLVRAKTASKAIRRNYIAWIEP
jgi:hypothetical protein